MALVLTKSKSHRGFVITWQDPPLTAASWTANIGTDDRHLYALMGISGVKIVDGKTRDEMIDRAIAYIDELLGPG